MVELFRLLGRVTVNRAEVEADLTAVEKKAAKTGQAMAASFMAVGKGLTAGVTLPLAIAATAAVKFRADFDQAMTASLAIMGDISDEMRDRMEDAARDVARTTRFSATQAADSYFYLASAGLDASQSLAAMPRVAAFAQAGAFDMARATDLLTDAQSALGLTVRDTTENMANMNRVSDVLVKANTLANATVSEFSEALTNKAGAALRLLSKDIEEGVAVLATFADQGVKGTLAGEQLNIVMRDLQRTALNNRNEFARLNIHVYDSEGRMRNLADIIDDVSTATAGMSDETMRATLMQLGFQDRSVSSIMMLLGLQDKIRDYEKGLRDAAGTTQEVADKQIDNLTDKLGLLKDRLKDVAIEIGGTLVPIIEEDLLPALEPLLLMVSTAIERFTSWPPALRKAAIGATALVAAIGPLLMGMGGMMKLWPLMTAGAAGFASFLLSPAGAIAAIGLLVAALIAATQTSDAFWQSLIGEAVQASDRAQAFKQMKALEEELAVFKERARIIREAPLSVPKELLDTIKEIETELTAARGKYTALTAAGAELIAIQDELVRLQTEAAAAATTAGDAVGEQTGAILELDTAQQTWFERTQQIVGDPIWDAWLKHWGDSAVATEEARRELDKVTQSIAALMAGERLWQEWTEETGGLEQLARDVVMEAAKRAEWFYEQLGGAEGEAQLAELAKTHEEATSRIEDYWLSTMRNVKKSVSDLLYAMASGADQQINLWEQVCNTMRRLWADMVADMVTEWMSNILGLPGPEGDGGGGRGLPWWLNVIPFLQHGGVFTQPTLAVVGDVPEVVLPLSSPAIPALAALSAVGSPTQQPALSASRTINFHEGAIQLSPAGISEWDLLKLADRLRRPFSDELLDEGVMFPPS